jgi:hypothetical protein
VLPWYAAFPLLTPDAEKNSVTLFVADRSLTFFLFFLIIYFGYALYNQHQDFERLFKIATDQQETIIKQRQAIEAQKTYIKVLEMRRQNDYPLHNKLL